MRGPSRAADVNSLVTRELGYRCGRSGGGGGSGSRRRRLGSRSGRGRSNRCSSTAGNE